MKTTLSPHKYRLFAFGTKSGITHIFYFDDVSGALFPSHKLQLPKNAQIARNGRNGPGEVRELAWSPDGQAIATSWEHGGLAVWSVFGACLMNTWSGDYAYTAEGLRRQPHVFQSMCWGGEGYKLWLVGYKTSLNTPEELSKEAAIKKRASGGNITSDRDQRDERDDHDSKSLDSESSKYQTNYQNQQKIKLLMQMDFVKSVLTVNPCMSNHLHVCLQGEDRLYLSSAHMMKRMASSSISGEFNGSPLNIVGNKQWTVIQFPPTYLSANWPIRFVAVDNSGQYIAINGNFGFAHYSLISRRWKLFGNVTQERNFIVTGGLAWWDDYWK